MLQLKYIWSSYFRIGKTELDCFCCRVNICEIIQFWSQVKQFSDTVCVGAWPLGVMGKAREKCLEDGRVWMWHTGLWTSKFWWHQAQGLSDDLLLWPSVPTDPEPWTCAHSFFWTYVLLGLAPFWLTILGMWWACWFDFSKQLGHCHIFGLLLLGMREDRGVQATEKHEKKRKNLLFSSFRTSSFKLHVGRHYLSGEPPGPSWDFQYTMDIWREDQN